MIDLLESDQLLQKYCSFVDDKINELIPISWDERKSIIQEPGIYLIYNHDLVYVGQTSNMHYRVNQHEKGNASMLKDKIQDYTGINPLTYLQKCSLKILPIKLGRLEVEQYLIHKYNPIFNNYKLRKRYNK